MVVLWGFSLIAGEQKRTRRLILMLVVRGTCLAFLPSSNWNKWYVRKRQSKGPGEDFKVCGMGHEFSRELGKCNFPKHMSGPAFTCLLVQATTSREQNCNIFMRYMK